MNYDWSFPAMSSWHLHHGDALTWLPTLDAGGVDAVITDPPYNSGGRTTSARLSTTPLRKYGSHGDANNSSAVHRYVDFAGDNRDQHGYTAWLALVFSQCLRATAPGGILVTFTDWRQLPATSDALQAAGWTWRGIIPWIKPNARPQLGRFRQTAEFIVWGTNGARPLEGSVHPGDFRVEAPRARSGRIHLTEKPLDLMRALVRIAPEAGTVLDPFVGAGTTGHAALMEGRSFLGAEITEHYHRAAVDRLTAAAASPQGVLEAA
ncbi:DNA-methyltransferase [Streptomyces nigrescens]|uniref:DNA-methyltransferase n=1 Tax=Streptomyces nigrescens TaxID=1920 RepID=UPI002251912F|nr:DNA methyltransferase [Streptomyces libani]MCX5445996.1 DNA methyltransferase [Streptomyces libani]